MGPSVRNKSGEMGSAGGDGSMTAQRRGDSGATTHPLVAVEARLVEGLAREITQLLGALVIARFV